MRKRLHPRRRRGAYFVELSFTLIPMLAIMFAIVDYSMPVFFRSLMTHAVREGSRYGITFRTESGKSQTESIQNVVMGQSAGFLAGESNRSKIKVRYYNQLTFVQDLSSARNADGNIIEVAVEGFEWKHMLPLYRMSSPSVMINATSADRLETLPAGGTRPTP